MTIGFVDGDAMICVSDSVFEVVVTDCNLGFVEISLCRVGRVENGEFNVDSSGYTEQRTLF